MGACELSLGEISRARTRIKVSLIDAFGKLHFAGGDDIGEMGTAIEEMEITVNRLKKGYTDLKGNKVFGSKDWIAEETNLRKRIKNEKVKFNQEPNREKKDKIVNKIEDLETDLARARQEERKLVEEQKTLLKEIKVKKKDKMYVSSTKRQGKNKNHLIKTINATLFDRMDRLLRSKGYNGDPHLYVNALKGFMFHNKFIFNDLQDLDVSELRSLNNYINSIFKSQDKGILIGRGGRFSKGQRVDEFYDPVYAAILHDKSLNALDIIQRTQRYSDNREKDIRIEMGAVKEYQAKIIRTVKIFLLKEMYTGACQKQI